MSLRKKQSATHEEFISAWRNIRDIVSRERIDFLVESAVEEIGAKTSGRVAFGWSGGKDSLALEVVANAAGISNCVFAMTDLEYPVFLQWVTDHMPPGLRVINNGWDLNWLAAHPNMLFPPDSPTAAKWYAGVQWKGQARYIKEESIDYLLVGRRYSDGNVIPDGGISRKKNGECRFSPIRHWSHEEVLAAISYHDLELPPIYDWPRGFRVGTGPWPARRWCRGIQGGWGEVWTIDSDIVRAAADIIPSAAEFLKSYGLS